MTEIANVALYLAEKYGLVAAKDSKLYIGVIVDSRPFAESENQDYGRVRL